MLMGFICSKVSAQKTFNADKNILTGAEQTEQYLSLLEHKNIALVVNQTSLIKNRHLVDTLLKKNIHIVRIFAPEHGFRGNADAGEEIKNDTDPNTNIPLISLYGENKKPDREHLKNIDLILFDIQDVGVRFYTYISTLHYVMEACAENKIPLLLLDRPNPNGFYVDGPLLKKESRSFVGIDPVPVVYGMTIGEYAQMLNGEEWLKEGLQCDLKIIPLKNYTHQSIYELPVKPSPNLPNMTSILLYPSLCFFEGTVISVGRGTTFPFQVIGHPDLKESFTFKPVSIPGMSKHPPLEGKTCHGIDLRNPDMSTFQKSKKLRLEWLLQMYQEYPDKTNFFNPFFEKLVGSPELKKQIIENKSEQEIRTSWKKDLRAFKKIRKKYLLYK